MISIGFNLDDMQSELLCVRKNRRFVMRCTEERAHELVENAYSADQLTKFVHKYGLCDVCNFTGLDMSASRVIVNCVITVMYKYPCLRGSMCYIGSKKGYIVLLKNFSAYDEYTLKSLGVQHICDSNTAKSVGEAMISMLSEADKDSEANVLAQAISGVGLLDGILLDENDFSTSRFLQIKKNLRQSVKSKFSPEGCDSVTSVIYHELGHMLDYLCNVSADKEVFEQYEKSSKHDIGKALSTYAASSIQEYIAEGFAEFMSNSSPRETARFIANTITRCYQSLIAKR